MTRCRLLFALLLVAVPAGSTTPCPKSGQIGERLELVLHSVTVDGAPVGTNAYAGYDVAIQAEVTPDHLDGVTNYIRFDVYRAEADEFGRQQWESLAEFYPAY